MSVRLRHDTLINNDTNAIKPIAIAVPACHLFSSRPVDPFSPRFRIIGFRNRAEAH